MAVVRSLRLDKITEDLNNNATISAVVPWGVFFGYKWRDDNQNATAFDTYINTRILTDVVQANGITKIARVEFTFVANRNVAPAVLLDTVDVVVNELVTYWCGGIKTFTDTTDADSINIQRVREWSMNWPDHDDLNRVVIRKDFLFVYHREDG